MTATLCGAAVSPDEIERMATILPGVLEELNSLEKFVGWLESQECVKSVKLADHLVKTWPPLRELIVEFKMSDGSFRQKVIDIFDTEDGKYSFKEMHDAS